jgi:hypothetical protein
MGVRVRQQSRSLSAEVGFEDERGCYLVDDLAALGPVLGGKTVSGAIEDGMGVSSSVAFVEEMERWRWIEMLGEMGSESFGEGFGFGRLRTSLSGGVDGKAYQHCRYVVAADETGDRLEVGFQGCAVDREKRLCGVAECVGQCDTDAAVADVKSENALEWHSN